LKNYYAILFYLSILFGSFFIFSGAKYQVVASAKTALENGSQGVQSLVSSTIASPRAGFGEIPAKIQPSTTSVYAYITEQAKKVGISLASTTFIVSHESQFDTEKVGDDGICPDPKSPNYGKETTSRGTWQINSCYHPEVSDQCAFNLQCSTAFSLKLIAAGGINQWSTYRLCKKLYGVCPK
jgi:hypothetical protein